MVATKTDGFLMPPITPENFYLMVRNGLTAAGLFSPIAEQDNHVVFEISGTPGKTYGTLYFDVWTDGLTVGQRLHSLFDSQTGEGSNSDTFNQSVAFSDEVSIQWVALNAAPEFRLLLLYQDEFFEDVIALGYIRPASKPAYWDENTMPYGFVCSVSDSPLRRWKTADLNPYENEDVRTNLYDFVPHQLNPFDNQTVDLVSKVLFIPENSRGLAGQSSPDLGQVTNDELDSRSLVVVGSQQYMVIMPGQGSSSPVVRIL